MKRLWIGVVFLLVLSLPIFGGGFADQTYNFEPFAGIEALEKRLEAAGPTERLALLNQLSSRYRETRPDKADAFNREALALGEASGDLLGFTEAKLQRAYGDIAKGLYGDAVIVLEGLTQDLSKQSPGAFSLGELPTDALDALDITQVLSSASKAYNSKWGTFDDQDLHWAVLVGQYRNAFGIIWSQLGDSSRSQRAFEMALQVSLEARYPRGVGQSLHNLATLHLTLESYDTAVTFGMQALQIFEALGSKDEIADAFVNLAQINLAMGQIPSALNRLESALGHFEALNDLRGQAVVQMALGEVFFSQGLNDQALESFSGAMAHFEGQGDLEGLGNAHLNMGALLEKQGDYGEAILAYEKARDAFYDWALVLESQGLGQVGAPREGLVVAANNRGTAYYQMGLYGEALAAHLEAYQQAQALAYEEGLKRSLFNLAQDYTALEDYRAANDAMQLYVALEAYLQEALVLEKAQQQQVLFETEKKERDLVAEQLAKAQEQRKRLIWSGIAMLVSLAGLVITGLLVLVARERKRSEKLLLNILPQKVANALKRFGKSDPERFDGVTVYFSDIVNFTTASSTMDPALLIEELNALFTIFDEIMAAHGCERIKTIGDAYMAVCGMPIAREDHAQQMLQAALEIKSALENRNAQGGMRWEIRIGLHSGSVVGGIVGIKKYIYDVFGDTINTASRMESNSVPMGINLSEATYKLVAAHPEIVFEKREPLPVKGKGQMSMYFAKRI